MGNADAGSLAMITIAGRLGWVQFSAAAILQGLTPS
jgi:hypothetical protein